MSRTVRSVMLGRGPIEHELPLNFVHYDDAHARVTAQAEANLAGTAIVRDLHEATVPVLAVPRTCPAGPSMDVDESHPAAASSPQMESLAPPASSTLSRSMVDDYSHLSNELYVASSQERSLPVVVVSVDVDPQDLDRVMVMDMDMNTAGPTPQYAPVPLKDATSVTRTTGTDFISRVLQVQAARHHATRISQEPKDVPDKSLLRARRLGGSATDPFDSEVVSSNTRYVGPVSGRDPPLAVKGKEGERPVAEQKTGKTVRFVVPLEHDSQSENDCTVRNTLPSHPRIHTKNRSTSSNISLSAPPRRPFPYLLPLHSALPPSSPPSSPPSPCPPSPHDTLSSNQPTVTAAPRCHDQAASSNPTANSVTSVPPRAPRVQTSVKSSLLTSPTLRTNSKGTNFYEDTQELVVVASPKRSLALNTNNTLGLKDLPSPTHPQHVSPPFPLTSLVSSPTSISPTKRKLDATGSVDGDSPSPSSKKLRTSFDAEDVPGDVISLEQWKIWKEQLQTLTKRKDGEPISDDELETVVGVLRQVGLYDQGIPLDKLRAAKIGGCIRKLARLDTTKPQNSDRRIGELKDMAGAVGRFWEEGFLSNEDATC